MKNGASFTIGLVLGAGIGFGVGYFVLKGIFEKKAQKQIDLMAGIMHKDEHDIDDNRVMDDHLDDYERTEEDVKIAEELTSHYRNQDPNQEYPDLDDPDAEPEYTNGYDSQGNPYPAPDKNRSPYLIMYAEIGERPNFSVESLTMYADGKITDEYGELIEGNELEDRFGPKTNLDAFGYDETQPDIVAIRNEKYQIDYEICRSIETYLEAMGAT